MSGHAASAGGRLALVIFVTVLLPRLWVSITYRGGMTSAMAYEAVVVMDPPLDEGAPGAAVTTELCGHWNHRGTCRWPHHTSVDRLDERTLRVRTIAIVEHPGEVAARISRGLNAGSVQADDEPGQRTWRVVKEGLSEVREGEAGIATRLARTTG